ncbi:TRAP transporter large permease subunit [Pseudooceanicola sp. GBMRC 2024]|uniref:TRAP transporter large permease subunit n=1 Tax=Pseudooceanicola albus TaxID=2692189 RepID=A0A6L7G132_9RHOB|nr:TRAP transporter large permease subunit [Pseudooceanicola albus]MXN17761.1 TRAP transporter large permease subunit [Pseudooceanicola albus]
MTYQNTDTRSGAAKGRGLQVQALARALHRGLSALLGAAAAFVLLVMLVIVTVNIVLRYGFASSILGAEDAGIWLNVIIVSLGAPLALGSALAMRLDVVQTRLGARGQAVSAVIADTITLLSGLAIAFGGAQVVQLVGGSSDALGLPESIRFGFFAVGGGLVLVMVVLEQIASGRMIECAIALVAALAIYFGAGQVHLSPGLPPSICAALIILLGVAVSAPMPHAFFAAAFLAIPLGASIPEPAMINIAVNGASKFLLLAIPFFLLSGTLLTVSGVAERLIRFAAACVGHLRGGLGQTTLLTNLMFSGASGSSIANAAFGSVTLYPELVRNGYRPERAGAIVAASSILDNVVPPSIAFLVLATVTNLSVGKLLVGGLWAGLLLAAALFVALRLTVNEAAVQPRAGWGLRGHTFLRALPAFGLGLIVVFGIRFGIVTTTEAAAAAALYSVGLAVIFARARGAGLLQAFRGSAIEAAAIGMMIASAHPFVSLLAIDNVAGLVKQAASLLGSGPVAVTLLAVIILLIAGLFIDTGAAILILGPLLLPAAVAAGLDPITFGVIIVVTLMIGGLTPPLGVLIFVVAGITNVPSSALFRSVVPYVAALVCALILICAYAILSI